MIILPHTIHTHTQYAYAVRLTHYVQLAQTCLNHTKFSDLAYWTITEARVYCLNSLHIPLLVGVAVKKILAATT